MTKCPHHQRNVPVKKDEIQTLLQKHLAGVMSLSMIEQITNGYITFVADQEVCEEAAITFFSAITGLCLGELHGTTYQGALTSDLLADTNLIPRFEDLVVELHGTTYLEDGNKQLSVAFAFRAALLSHLVLHKRIHLALAVYQAYPDCEENWMDQAESFLIQGYLMMPPTMFLTIRQQLANLQKLS